MLYRNVGGIVLVTKGSEFVVCLAFIQIDIRYVLSITTKPLFFFFCGFLVDAASFAFPLFDCASIEITF